MKKLQQTLELLRKNDLEHHLGALNRGLEKESLRIDADGMLAQTPHPRALGSALAHGAITTDYSEALLEFVTPIHRSVDDLLRNLYDIHHFAYQHLGDEKLWASSMPCVMRGEAHIPIARYGASNVAKMKEAYRRGLRLRYGSRMQTIAGIHFNFSLPEAFWQPYIEAGGQRHDAPDGDLQQQKSAHYFALIRNFHRHSWLPCYLFGASPAVCKTFLEGREHALDDFDAHSFYAPHATSLRLSGLGYASSAQADIEICYNSVASFVASLRRAIRSPWPAYAHFGVKVDGEYRQLNANMLQIENEFYSVIRPKRVADSGESPARALLERGVQYVEVRSVDLNPYAPIGIDAHCARFFDLLLLYCLFSHSPNIERDEWRRAADNRHRVVMRGRQPGLMLGHGKHGAEAPLADLAAELLRNMQPLAALLDEVGGGGEYQATLQAQMAKVRHPALTPAAQIIQHMSARRLSFYEFAMDLARSHEDAFKAAPMAPPLREKMRAEAAQSHRAQKDIENRDTGDFDAFLADYFRRQNADDGGG